MIEELYLLFLREMHVIKWVVISLFQSFLDKAVFLSLPGHRTRIVFVVLVDSVHLEFNGEVFPSSDSD